MLPSILEIFQTCQLVHMVKKDTMSGVSQENFLQAKRNLETRLKNWKQPSSQYDEAVRNLIIQTLQEKSIY